MYFSPSIHHPTKKGARLGLVTKQASKRRRTLTVIFPHEFE